MTVPPVTQREARTRSRIRATGRPFVTRVVVRDGSVDDGTVTDAVLVRVAALPGRAPRVVAIDCMDRRQALIVAAEIAHNRLAPLDCGLVGLRGSATPGTLHVAAWSWRLA